MTDNFGSLRQAMSDLSEHGGSTDMYERSLRKSRQSQRRITVTTAVAVAVVAAVGGTVALAAADRPNLSAPVADEPPGPSAASPSSPGCPSAKDLQQLVELPTGWSFVPSGVQCAQGWAAIAVKRPASGNGIYLFHYKAGTGWRYYDEGTGWNCKDLGLTEATTFCAL
jgi:hypothetical protein